MDLRKDNNENSGYNNDLINTSGNNDSNNSYNNNNNDNFNNSGYNNNYNNDGFNNNSYNNDSNNFHNNYNNGFHNNSYNNNDFNNNYNQAPNGTNGYAVASLVLGIISIPFGCCYGLGLIFSIISIIFGVVSRKSNGGKLPGMSLAGIICSVLGIICSLFMIFAVIVTLSTYDFTNMDINEIINSIEGSSSNNFY